MKDPFEARAEAVFLELCELDREQQGAALVRHCEGDETLAARVRELLASEEQVPTGFLEGRALPPGVYLEPGTSFAGFRILRRVGEGGMGTVYAAMQSMPRREVALKVVRPGRMSRDALRRFHHEVEVLGNLHHPGIARIYEAGTATYEVGGVSTQQPYFAMELVKGEPLLAYVRANALDDAQKLELLARLCDAVQHAHQRAVIHRDLKPENVLVTIEESTSSPERSLPIGRPVILDFGIARAIGPQGVATQGETRAGDIVGTLAYMSPEQLVHGGAAIDVRSDVYALGVLLYQLLAGRLPHDLGGKDLPSALRELREGEPPPLEDVVPRLKGDVSTIVAKALAKDVERRYPSALDLASDIRRHLAGEPIRARSDSTLYVVRRQLRRHRWALGIAAGIALLVTAFAVSYAMQAEENRLLARREASARERAAADFDHALEAITTLVEVGHRRLAGVPQAEAARRELLLAARDFHERLLADREGDPTLHEGLLRTKLTAVRILNYLGEHEACRRDAEKLRAELELAPSSPERDWILSETLRLLGISYDELGLSARAEEAFEETNTFAESASGGELDWMSVNRLAARHYDSRRYPEAEALLAPTIPVLDARVDTYPSPENRVALASNLQLLGIVHEATDRYPEADAHLGRAVEILRTLCSELPENAVYRASLVIARMNHGIVFTSMGRTDEAISAQREAAELGEAMARDFPAVAKHREILVEAYTNLVSAARAETSLAENSLVRAQELVDGLIAEDPETLRYQALALILTMNHGTWLMDQERLEEAEAELASAIEFAQFLESEMPDDYRLFTVLNDGSVSLAVCRTKLGDHQGAMESLDTIDGLLTRDGVRRALQTAEDCIRLAAEAAGDDFEGAGASTDRYAESAALLVERSLARGLRVSPDFWASFETLRTFPRFDQVVAGASGD